jgi:hypothetical protein
MGVQVFNSAWNAGVKVASENALSCYDRRGYNKILANSKPKTDSDARSLVAFTYLRLSPELMEYDNFLEFTRFVRRLQGNDYSFLSCKDFFTIQNLRSRLVSIDIVSLNR